MVEVPQTLKEALIAEGNPDQAALLIPETAKLTRADIIGFVNKANWVTDSGETLSDAGKANLRKISVMRLKSGQPFFPWNDQDFLNSFIEDFAGFVY